MVEVGITSAVARVGSFRVRVSAFFISNCSNCRLVCASRNQLLILRDGALRAHRFDRSQAADLDLLLGVGESFLRKGQRFILHAGIFVGVDQVPVDIFDLIDRIDDLQAESYIGKFAIVLGDANETSVGRKSKTLQQGLGESSNLKFELSCGLNVEKKLLVVCRRVVEPHIQIRAPLKRLVVGEINRARVLNQAAAGKYALKNDCACWLK